MKTIRVKAKGTGRIVAWRPFNEGRLEVATTLMRCFGLTTTLPDVLVDVMETARRHDPAMTLSCIVANGTTTTQLDLSLIGQGFQIVCARRLVRGGFPFNLLAPEFGANYDVVVTLDGDPAFVSSLVNQLHSRYECIDFPETGRSPAAAFTSTLSPA